MLSATATTNGGLADRFAGFATLAEALDYAAKGETGFNFYGARGELVSGLTYAELRARAIGLAQGLVGAGLERGARVAIMAETVPGFFVFFFACQYAGLVPVPLPLPTTLGGKDSYVERLRRMIERSGASAAVSSGSLEGDLRSATSALPVGLVGRHEEFEALPGSGVGLRPLGGDELCYIQYSSGSTRFPLGIAISQRSMRSNAEAVILHGLEARPGDRGVSWLPLYHDMGLVGFCLTPLMAQISVDYMSTSDFARRPLLWLEVLSANGGTLSFSPTFGYELCLRRAARGVDRSFDLSSWRVAGIGGEMIREDVLAGFAERFAGSGFRRTSFVASYGLAEATLAVSLSSLDGEVEVDRVDKRRSSRSGRAVRARGNGSGTRSFVICGRPLRGHVVVSRDEAGRDLADRRIGRIHVKGPSVMAGYFGDPEATSRVVTADGWLDTGDMGYMLRGSVVITGRSKDLIICNGRNIWPQDIEWEIERVPGVRHGDVAAFSVSGSEEATERVVIVVQCRLPAGASRHRLAREIAGVVRTAEGVDCEVVLAPPRSLPLTSSGKLSRSWTKAKYLSGRYAAPLEGRETPATEPTTEPAAEPALRSTLAD